MSFDNPFGNAQSNVYATQAAEAAVQPEAKTGFSTPKTAKAGVATDALTPFTSPSMTLRDPDAPKADTLGDVVREVSASILKLSDSDQAKFKEKMFEISPTLAKYL